MITAHLGSLGPKPAKTIDRPYSPSRAHAKRVGIWVPGGSLDHVEGNALVMQYFREVGRLLSDKHFTDAKSRAKAFQDEI